DYATRRQAPPRNRVRYALAGDGTSRRPQAVGDLVCDRLHVHANVTDVHPAWPTANGSRVTPPRSRGRCPSVPRLMRDAVCLHVPVRGRGFRQFPAGHVAVGGAAEAKGEGLGGPPRGALSPRTHWCSLA